MILEIALGIVLGWILLKTVPTLFQFMIGFFVGLFLVYHEKQVSLVETEKKKTKTSPKMDFASYGQE